jgi:hypothetical protein
MNMAGFTAEVALCRSSGHYRTGEHALSLFRQMNRLRPAMERGEVPPITVPGETIPVHSCAPGWELRGGICWPPPLTEPSSGGGGDPGMPGGPDGGGGPGPGSGEPPERPEPQDTKPPRPPIRKPYHPRVGDDCHVEYLLMRGSNAIDQGTPVRTGKYTRNTDPRKKHKYNCDDADNSKIEYCNNTVGPIKTDDGDDRWFLCFDGHR